MKSEQKKNHLAIEIFVLLFNTNLVRKASGKIKLNLTKHRNKIETNLLRELQDQNDKARQKYTLNNQVSNFSLCLCW